MFELFLQLSEYAINYYFKNEKRQFRKLLRTSGNPPSVKLIFKKFSEETDFTGKVEQAKA